jgi:hypothetical protein
MQNPIDAETIEFNPQKIPTTPSGKIKFFAELSFKKATVLLRYINYL